MLEGYSDSVYRCSASSVAFLHDSTRLASRPTTARSRSGTHAVAVPPDAREPQRFGQLGGLLTQLDTARVSKGRPHSQDLGRMQ